MRAKKKWRFLAPFHFEFDRTFVFPVIGSRSAFRSRFGLWSALAIHDTSLSSAPPSRYGTGSVIIGHPQARAGAWIVPLGLHRRIKHGNPSHDSVVILFFFLPQSSTPTPTRRSASAKFFTLGKLGLTARSFSLHQPLASI